MCRVYKTLVFLLVFLLIDIEFLYVKSAYAVENEKVNFSMGNASDVKASNPNCQLSRAVTEGVIIAFAASIVLIIGAAVVCSTGVGLIVGGLLMAAGIASLIGIVMVTPGYFACKWSFVRHPVMRNKDGHYVECENPFYVNGGKVVDQLKYQRCANKEYADETKYYQCLGDGDKDKGMKNEPTCPDATYKEIRGTYYWPKNRISNSEHIEFCYRNPLSTALVVGPLVANSMEVKGYKDLDSAFTGQDEEKDANGKVVFEEKKPAGFGETNQLYPREAYSIPGNGTDAANIKRAKAYIRGNVDCRALKIGETETFNTITFQAIEKSDKICVNAVKSAIAGIWPQPEIGCHMRPSNTIPSPICKGSIPKKDEKGNTLYYDNSPCFNENIHESCYGVVGREIKSVFPVTSMVVSCIRESLRNFTAEKSGHEGMLGKIRKRLQNTVHAVLVLALMLFAIKATLGGVQNSSEVYMLAIKFAMVIYFTTGNGIMDKYYDQVINLSMGLSDIVLSAGGNTSVCNFTQDSYADKHKYLALWDKLDCRMMFYLGSSLNGQTGYSTTLVLLLSGALLVAAVLLGGQILICLTALFAVFMILFIVIWIVYLYILSLIGLTILALISPLIIPMLLFQITRPFFDGWLKAVIAFALYPVILFSFVALVFSVFDNLYFGKLQFRAEEIKILDFMRTKFVLIDSDQCNNYYLNDKNPDTSKDLFPIACIISSMNFFSTPLFLGVSVTSLESGGVPTKDVWISFGLFALMGFLFYHFLLTIGALAAELSGSPRLNLADSVNTNPAKMMNKALGYAKSLSGKTSGAVMKGYNAARGGLSPNTGKSSESMQDAGEKK